MRNCWSKKTGITSSTPAKRREGNQLGKGRGQSRPFPCSKGTGAASQAIKSSPNFCGPREGKKRTPPGKAEKGETGCVLGAGGDGSRCGQMQTDVKTHCLNQREHHNHTTHVKRKPAETQCFRRFCGRGRRTWSPLRSGRLVACVPLARTRPSARGFGVDVGKCSKEQGRAGVARFLPQVRKGGVLVWCYGEILRDETGETPRKSRKHIN